MCYNVFKEVGMRLLELLLTHPLNTVILTLCICVLIFIAGATTKLLIEAVKGEETEDVSS